MCQLGSDNRYTDGRLEDDEKGELGVFFPLCLCNVSGISSIPSCWWRLPWFQFLLIDCKTWAPEKIVSSNSPNPKPVASYYYHSPSRFWLYTSFLTSVISFPMKAYSEDSHLYSVRILDCVTGAGTWEETVYTLRIGFLSAGTASAPAHFLSPARHSSHIRPLLPMSTNRDGASEELKKVYFIYLLLESRIEVSMFLLLWGQCKP